MTVRSFAATYFIHRSFEDAGRWHDTGMRFQTEAEATYMGRRILNRIYHAMPKLYGTPDFAEHVFAGPVGDPVNCWVHADLMDQVSPS